MSAIELLTGEHRVIRQVLACLTHLADRCAAGTALDLISALRALDLLRHFVHGCHQEKEERLLFPLLEARGFLPDEGPLAVLRAEHAQARRHLRALGATVELAGIGEPGARERFVASAWAYASLTRNHARKEDCLLFPVAGRLLSRSDQDQLLDAFSSLEDEGGEGAYERYLAEADALAGRCASHRLAAELCFEPARNG